MKTVFDLTTKVFHWCKPCISFDKSRCVISYQVFTSTCWFSRWTYYNCRLNKYPVLIKLFIRNSYVIQQKILHWNILKVWKSNQTWHRYIWEKVQCYRSISSKIDDSGSRLIRKMKLIKKTSCDMIMPIRQLFTRSNGTEMANDTKISNYRS